MKQNSEKYLAGIIHCRFIAQFVMMMLVLPAMSFAQDCDQSSFNLGKIDSHWLYKNEALKISFQLPEGWYLFDQLATEKKYVKIGSDYKKLSAPIVDDGPGPIVGLDQIKTYPLDYALTLFSLAKLKDSIALVATPTEFQQNNTLSFKAYYAEIKEADELLKVLYRKFTGTTGEPEVKNGKLGELEYRYMMVAVTNKSGITENRIYGVRNFGCVNVIIRIIYIADVDLSTIMDACKDLKVSP